MPLNSTQRSRRQAFISSRRLRGVDVIYTQGADDVPLTAIPAQTNTTVEDSSTRQRLRSSVRDYLILPEDLVDADDVQIYPEPGDLITEGDTVYEVPQELAGEPCWRWDDEQTKQVFRVHTQLYAGT